jgi:polyisoprenoid-binding protein YceI
VISFKSTGVAYSGNTGKMTGNLTLMGVTKPVTLDVTYNGSSGTGNRARMGFSAKGVIKRSDFGFTAMIGPLGDDVTFQIETELAKQ